MSDRPPAWVSETTLAPEGDLLSKEDLARENERLRAVLGHCPQSIAVLDERGKLLGYNREFEDLFQTAPEIGQTVASLFEVTDEWLVDNVIHAAASGRKAAALVHLKSETPDERFIEFLVATLPGADGGPVGVILSGDDRTKSLKEEWERTSAANTIATLNVDTALELGRKVINHELTTHVASARLAVNAIAKSEAAEREAFIAQARESLELAAALMTAPPAAEHVSDPDLANVSIAAEQAARAVPVRPGRITVKIDVPTGLYVEMAQWELTQVLTNLISNAAHSLQESERKGSISILAERTEEGSIHLSVRDNGPGFRASELQTAFELGTTTRAKCGGEGIGLALVRSVVERAGGKVQIFSEPGVGCEVGIVLPAGAHRISYASA